MAIIMLLALIIIGPKDLPRVARTIGQWVRKGRMLAREFQTSLEDMAKEAELDDVKKEIEKVGKTDLKKAVENTIDPKGDLAKAFDTSDPTSPAGTEDAGAKALNGSAEAKAGGESATQAKPATKTAATSPKASAPKKKSTAAAKKPVAAAKKPAASAKKPAAAKAARTAKKPATPRKRAAKPASSAQSGSKSGGGDPSPSSADDGGAAVAAKSS